MKILKWFTQGVGIGLGVLAVCFIYEPIPQRPRKIKRWMFSEYDEQNGIPWNENAPYVRGKERLTKVVDHLDSVWNSDSTPKANGKPIEETKRVVVKKATKGKSK